MAKKKQVNIPPMEVVQAEKERMKQNSRFRAALNSTVAVLIVVAAAAILVATLVLPVLQIYGSSMTPVLAEGEIVVLTKRTELSPGDIVAFYYNNKILVKRVIGLPGDWISIDEDGNVYRNSQWLQEPYLTEKSLGECDLEFPYQVPEGGYFVMGDHRAVSIDSRSSVVGCIREEQLVGRVFLRVWPLNKFDWTF